MKCDNDPLAVEQNNYTTKMVNAYNSYMLNAHRKAYIAYELDAWPKVPLDNLKFKNCLFGATSVVKNSDKEKWVNSGYEITFDDAGSWSFGNDVARNVVIFL